MSKETTPCGGTFREATSYEVHRFQQYDDYETAYTICDFCGQPGHPGKAGQKVSEQCQEPLTEHRRAKLVAAQAVEQAPRRLCGGTISMMQGKNGNIRHAGDWKGVCDRCGEEIRNDQTQLGDRCMKEYTEAELQHRTGVLHSRWDKGESQRKRELTSTVLFFGCATTFLLIFSFLLVRGC